MDTSGSTVAVNDTTSTPRGRGCGCWIALVVVLLLGGAVSAYMGGIFALRQEKPTGIEMAGADAAVRLLMIDPSYTDWRMPDKYKGADQIARGKDLFGAQCSLCHGQSGKGDGSFGVTQFPPAADLTQERTQSKTDGQLFWLIWHGMNYTGMPAWGKENGGPNDQDEIWTMVSYIRSLRGGQAATK